MSKENPLPKPEKAKRKPKKITTKNKPGGSQTPGAKAERQTSDSNNG